MLSLLGDYQGSLEVNGIVYNSLNEAVQALNDRPGPLTIVLNKGVKKENKEENQIQELEGSSIYKIRVRQYMTRPASPEFDFHTKWNNDNPMPMRIMVGRKLKETRGMVQMELWGEITEEMTTHCMKCGRILKNKISQYFGIGPECGGHNYNNPFESDEELNQAVSEMQEQLKKIKWTGWVIKSAIEEETYLGQRVMEDEQD